MLPLSEEIKNRSFHDAQRLTSDIKTILEPLPWDPKWNRFEALIWEGPQASDEGAVEFWRKYLHDLEQGVPAPLGELRQVQALVWRRIGELTGSLASDADEEQGSGRPRKKVSPASAFRTQAIEAFQKSLQFDTTQRKTFQGLIDLHRSGDQPELVIATLEQLLKAFPDDVEALKQLIVERRWRDEAEQVLSYVERLRILRPLDPSLNSDEAWARLATARHLALKGRWDEGRAEFDRVERTLSQQMHAYRLLSRRAVLEFKAGDSARADDYIERAGATIKSPAVLWLSLAIEAVRYELPQALQDRFEWEFASSIAGKATSETAGALAELIAAQLVSRVDYSGRAGHIEQVVRYLKRTTRLKYREPDLRFVCAMLQNGDKQEALLATFLKRGVKLFPSCPYFLFIEAGLEMRRGPFSLNAQQTQKKLQKALALAEASQSPDHTELIPRIKEVIARSQDMSDMMGSFPFPFMRGGMPGSPEKLQEMFEMLFDDLDESDLDFEDDEPEPARPKKTPKRKPR